MMRHMAQRAARALRPAASRPLSTFEASKLTVTLTDAPKTPPPNEALKGQFGKIFSDHMLEVDWSSDGGWGAPRVVPYGDLALSPAAMALHYGLQCFEGMKAYRDASDTIRLFRPDLNAARLNSSLARLEMPGFDGAEFVECLKALLKVDAAWVPSGDGHAAYLRPTAIATDPFLGVGVPQKAKVFVICCPVGPYYAAGFDPISVLADAENVRAWPGGAGNTKVGGNYGPTIKPAKDAAAATGGQAQQVLYLFGEDHRVTEVGAMNVFVLWRTPAGTVELVTAPLEFGDILPGVTRRSILELARENPSAFGIDAVCEKPFTMPEVRQAANEGRLLEVFGAGTAAVVCPISSIFYEGAAVEVPTGAQIGPTAQAFWTALSDIHYGRTDSAWSVPVE